MVAPKIFVSYSRKDAAEKDELLTHLGVLQGQDLIVVWSDDRIGAGANWREEIEQAMAQADVAILLVTANFLNSSFIRSNEVPHLLKRRSEAGLPIFPIIAKYCAWQEVSWLAQLNVRPMGGTPVWRSGRRYSDRDLTAIVKEIAAVVQRLVAESQTAERDTVELQVTESPVAEPETIEPEGGSGNSMNYANFPLPERPVRESGTKDHDRSDPFEEAQVDAGSGFVVERLAPESDAEDGASDKLGTIKWRDKYDWRPLLLVDAAVFGFLTAQFARWYPDGSSGGGDLTAYLIACIVQGIILVIWSPGIRAHFSRYMFATFLFVASVGTLVLYLFA